MKKKKRKKKVGIETTDLDPPGPDDDSRNSCLRRNKMHKDMQPPWIFHHIDHFAKLLQNPC